MSSVRSRSGGSCRVITFKPVEEILAELAAAHQRLEVGVGGGDQADVDLDRVDAAQPHELLLLDDPQELRLGLDRDVADLVEEDRAVVGDLEQALLRGDRRR